MSKGLLIPVLSFFLFACGSKNKIPKDVLPQKKMQAVLWDMMRADQFLADYVLNKDTTKKKETESILYYQQIFALHKITRDEFQHSFAFYRSHPDLFRNIMDSISAPPGSVIVTPSNQVTTPLAKPDTTINVTTPIIADTPLPKRRRPVVD